MQRDAAPSLVALEITLAIRVFGPDAVRCCRRLLAAGVRIGITNMTGAARRPSAEPDECLKVEQ
ncbi:hypothetical protein OG730_04945 [Streptomyces sp. NBC_01298]|uniref:hypothetical protein n=1 Tax=Streptomyces sp. NBC_01298 TaxID=2903817 RepID=UPI002E0D25B2|nr:hypothetical protein OG730_04945 [Streptomyces sp. NBC_01298]